MNDNLNLLLVHNQVLRVFVEIGYLLLFAGMAAIWVSLFTVATLQVFKHIFSIRKHFNKKRLLIWISRTDNSLEQDYKKSLSLIADLSMAKGLNQLCALAPENLAGQLTIAAQRLLDMFIGNVKYKNKNIFNEYKNILEIFLGYKVDDSYIDYMKSEYMPDEQGQVKDTFLADDLSNQIHRNIDRLMLEMRQGWNYLLQTISYAVSFFMVILLASLISYSTYGGNVYSLFDTVTEKIMLLWTALIAGYLSPVLHNVISRFQRGSAVDAQS